MQQRLNDKATNQALMSENIMENIVYGDDFPKRNTKKEKNMVLEN